MPSLETPLVSNRDQPCSRKCQSHTDGPCQVAYENIDIHAGRPAPPLAAAVCAERVALQQRGGYCFIVVPAFGAMGYMTSFRHARPSVVLL
jgi:hypothetical protein